MLYLELYKNNLNFLGKEEADAEKICAAVGGFVIRSCHDTGRIMQLFLDTAARLKMQMPGKPYGRCQGSAPILCPLC